jgi:hypothetical protein
MAVKGDWGKITHVMNKPSFVDEHYVQTTLAAAGAEANVLPVSLTFATFGSRNQFTVWGDGGARPFKLESAEWHAVQFGALSMETMEKLHELCVYDPAATGPGDDDAAAEAARPARTFAGAYDPDKLACSVMPAPGRAAPCFLFGRKIHSEAVYYYAQLTAESARPRRFVLSRLPSTADPRARRYFLEKRDPSLDAPLAAARAAQRRDAHDEIQSALTGEGDPPPGDYARRNMRAVHDALPASVQAALRAATGR